MPTIFQEMCMCRNLKGDDGGRLERQHKGQWFSFIPTCNLHWRHSIVVKAAADIPKTLAGNGLTSGSS